METVTKGFIAKNNKNDVVKANVSIHDIGFYVVFINPGGKPTQYQRKYPLTVVNLIAGLKEYARKEGYTDIQDLGNHKIKKDKDTGMHKVAL